MDPTTRPSAPRAALVARAPGAARPAARLPAAQVRPRGRREGLRGGPEVGVLGRVAGEDLVQDGEEAAVLGEGAGRGRDLGRGADGQARVGRRGVEVGQEVGRGCGWGWGVRYDFLRRVVSSPCLG